MFILLMACAPADQAYVLGGAQVTVEPMLLDFGQVAEGETAELSLLVQNPDTVFASLELELKGRGFATERDSLELEPGAQVELPVWFTPYGQQAASGELMVSGEDLFLRVELLADAPDG